MIAQLAGLQQLVAFTFILTFFGMAAASLFLMLERHQVAAEFRLSVTIAGVICAVAAGNYFFIRQIYLGGAINDVAAFMTLLMGLSLGMLGFGYVGEVNPDNADLQLTLWVIGCGFGLAIFVPLGLARRRVPDHVSVASARTVRAMAALTLIGWLVYPIGYLQPLIGFPPDVRELINNIADLINKGGLGAVIFWVGDWRCRARAAVLPRADRDRARRATH